MTDTVHRCGCVTHWDWIGWRSVASYRCEAHAEQERLANAAVDPTPEKETT